MTIFIGNLNKQVTEYQLRSLFSEFGAVKSVKIILDNYIPETIFDNSRESEIDKYEIRTINQKKQSLSLIQSNKPQEMFTWPNDEERVYINYHDLVSENAWWISNCPEKQAESTQKAKLYEH